MTSSPYMDAVFLREANARSQTARNIVTGFSRSTPDLADLWQQLHNALADVPVLITEVIRLHDALVAARLDRANLAAAARAAIGAGHDRENDPLGYLLDELTAQGFWAVRR